MFRVIGRQKFTAFNTKVNAISYRPGQNSVCVCVYLYIKFICID